MILKRGLTDALTCKRSVALLTLPFNAFVAFNTRVTFQHACVLFNTRVPFNTRVCLSTRGVYLHAYVTFQHVVPFSARFLPLSVGGGPGGARPRALAFLAGLPGVCLWLLQAECGAWWCPAGSARRLVLVAPSWAHE
jgi:hypothetical protein